VPVSEPVSPLTPLNTALSHCSREMHPMNSPALLNSVPYQLGPAATFATPPPSIPDRRRAGFSSEAIEILDDVRRAMERNPDGAHAAALRLVTFLTPAASAGTRGGLAPWQKRKVERHLGEHLAQTLYVEELASQVSLSVSHFCRAFKESFGATPHRHIVELRLELARRLMLTTEEPLSQIALDCGMADQAHLSKLFRRGVGESPGAWRRRCLNDAEAEARCRRLKASRSAISSQ
jgi:AraC-like DNA-binding protein